METGLFLVLSVVCLSAYGLPSQKNLLDIKLPTTRNTIFGDERLIGEVFEKVDAFNDIDLTSTGGNVSEYRLPNTTRPTHYNIHWTIDLRTQPFRQSGVVNIHLHSTRVNVNEIVIHCDELTVTSVRLTQDGTAVPITSAPDPRYQLLKVRLTNGNMIHGLGQPVIYVLTVEFNAELRDNMYGIYKNWYRNSATEERRWMASTQFQPTAARWAFPCYDEPSYKATFDVTIRRQTGYESWFNTRRNRIITNAVAGFDDDVYERTPIMSTYLLALIVAQYSHLRVTNTQGQLVYEVIARPGAISQGQGDFALNTGQALLARMSTITRYDFFTQSPNLKMTQASIPDFGAGAMENWGLLTYREAYLMYDARETNKYFEQIIGLILSHEIAHMWYGNLVTCDWWDNLWLNEGFASYYEAFLTYQVAGMGFDTRYINEHVHTGLLADSADNPHALTNPGLNSNAAVSAMFSTISYQKGGAIIRMAEHLLGTAVFNNGLSNYLRARQFQTALPIHLFEHLRAAGLEAGALNYGPNFDFVEFFRSWTEQPGHPVLNVDVNHQTGMMTITQRRFNINSGYSTDGRNYIVPITFTRAGSPDFSNTKPTHILRKTVTVINRGSVGDEWVLFNTQQTGFYRVNYDDYTWDLIAMTLRTSRTSIHEYNRAQIVNDVFQFARSGIMRYDRALNILSYLENETDYAPWVAAITGFNWLRNRLAGDTTTAQLTLLNERILAWSNNVMNSLTYNPIPDEHFLRAYLRYQLAPLRCNLGDSTCTSSAATQFHLLFGANTSVPVDNRNWVYCNGLRFGGSAEYNFMYNRFITFNVYTEKMVVLSSLGCTNDQVALETFLAAIISPDSDIRPQDYNSAFNSAVNGNEQNTKIVLEFIQKNLVNVAAAFGGSVATPLSIVIARLRSRADITAFQTWAQAHQADLGSAYNSVIRNAEVALESIVWAESIQENINKYLVEGGDPITSSTAGTPAPPNTAVTQRPGISEPVTPALPTTPASATTSFLAAATVLVALVFNIVL